MMVARAGVLSVWSLRELSIAADREELGDPASARSGLDSAGALDGGGGEDGHPQAAVRTDGLLQREIVGVDLGEVHGRGTRDGGGIHEGQRAGRIHTVDGGGDARRGFVVRVGVRVDALGGRARC